MARGVRIGGRAWLALVGVTGCVSSPSSEETDSAASAMTTMGSGSDTDVATGADSDTTSTTTAGVTTGATATTTSTTADTMASADPTEPPQLTGMDLYYGDCLPCHGVDALGGEFGPELRHPDRPHATWVLRNGRPGDLYPLAEMFPYPADDISDEDAEKIWDFLDEFEQPATGPELYADYCGYCHGEDASGGTVGSDLRATTLEQNLDAVRAGFGGTDYGSRETYMPALDATALTDAEITAIVGVWSDEV